METALLIKEANKGITAAQKCLFDIWAGKMLVVCRRYVKNPEDAEELLLDGFYKIFKTLSSFQYHNDAGLHAWLKRIMINECLMFLRKKNVFHIVAESEATEISLEEEAISKLSANEIFNLIIQLPVGYRTVFNLYVVEGFDHKEIGHLLGISEGTSKSQLSRSKVLLQKLLLLNGTDYGKQNIQ